MADRRDERTRIMETVVRKLGEMQSVFQMNPGGTRGHGKPNPTHFLVNSALRKKAVFQVYINAGHASYVVNDPLAKSFDRFISRIPFKKGNKDYLELNVYSDEPLELTELTVQFSLDLMEYATKIEPRFGEWKLSVDINIPLSPKRIIETQDGEIHYVCGKCEYEYRKAPRCPECGQLVKE